MAGSLMTRGQKLGVRQPVAVLSRFPALRRGFATLLAETGFLPAEPPDVAVWVTDPENRVLLIAAAGISDVSVVIDLTSMRSDVVVVALLPEVTPRIVRDAVLAGVTSVTSWDASREEVISLLQAAVVSRSVVPTSMLQGLMKHSRVRTGPTVITLEEEEWLRALARGETVSQLAGRIAYSEREVYRMLRALYERLGVRGRTEALVWAVHHGVIV